MSTNINLLKALSQILFSATHEQLPVTSRGVSHASCALREPSSAGARLPRAPGRASPRGGIVGWHRGPASAPAPGRVSALNAGPSPLRASTFTELRGPLMAAPCLARAPWSRGHAGSRAGGSAWRGLTAEPPAQTQRARGGPTPSLPGPSPSPASSQADPFTHLAPVSFTARVWSGVGFELRQQTESLPIKLAPPTHTRVCVGKCARVCTCVLMTTCTPGNTEGQATST